MKHDGERRCKLLRQFASRKREALELAVGHDLFVTLRANFPLAVAPREGPEAGARLGMLAVIAVLEGVQVRHRHSGIGLPRNALILPRRILLWIRLRFDACVGRVGRRGRRGVAARLTRSCRRWRASARFSSRLRCRCALMTITPSRVMRWSRSARSRALTASGSEEAATSKRRCTALATLLTFCPPAPVARTAVMRTSFSGTSSRCDGVVTQAV